MKIELQQEILDELQSIENQMSGENLTCDGELSQEEVQKRFDELKKQRDKLIVALNYVPNENGSLPSAQSQFSVKGCMTDQELALELEKWFINNINSKNKWNRATGKILVKYLNETKNWKAAPRGRPFTKWNH